MNFPEKHESVFGNFMRGLRIDMSKIGGGFPLVGSRNLIRKEVRGTTDTHQSVPELLHYISSAGHLNGCSMEGSAVRCMEDDNRVPAAMIEDGDI